MDLPRYLATVIKYRVGKPAEAAPSLADIATDHFIVSVRNFWQEPNGTFSNMESGDYSFEQDGIPVEGFTQALPIRVVYRSKGAGEKWRGEVIEQMRLNAIAFSASFHLPVFGGKLFGKAAALCNDGTPEDIVNFDENNLDGPGLGMVVDLGRDPNSDIVFQPQTKNKKPNGFLAEQHFIGDIVFHGGAEVPNDQRRHIQ